MSKQVTIGQFLTEAQIIAALAIWRRDRANFRRRVVVEIIKPNMDEINRKLGQDNSPEFIGYALEYVFSKGEQ